jgi:hypothetical protein
MEDRHAQPPRICLTAVGTAGYFIFLLGTKETGHVKSSSHGGAGEVLIALDSSKSLNVKTRMLDTLFSVWYRSLNSFGFLVRLKEAS